MAAIDRFKVWASSDAGKEYFRAKIESFGDRKWVEGQYRLMCDWITDNPEKGDKRNWAKFAGNWLRRGYAKRTDDIANSKCPGLMTSQQEENHYSKPREKTFIKVGDILSGKAEKENS